MSFSPDPLFSQVQKELESLLSSTPYRVGDFVDKGEYRNYPNHGIYVFTDPDDKVIVYIGKSAKHGRGAGGRARHHERENKSEKGSVQRKLNVDRGAFRNYNVRVHEIVDQDVRGAAELYGIVVYVPKGNLFFW